MKPLSDLYRHYAAQEQAYADEAKLPNVRELHSRAANHWLNLAERAGTTEQRGPRN